MKKHLIAAAVAGAFAVPAMAQVTVSGKYGVGYMDTVQDGSGATVSDGDIRFSAAEDLGGGMKVNASMEVRIRGREAATQGEQRNATLGISGSFGRIHGGGIEFANGIFAKGSAGAPIALSRAIHENNATQVLAGEANSEYLRYDTPNISGFVFSVTYSDQITRGRANQAGYGLTGHIAYKAGPIDVEYNLTQWTDMAADARRHRISGNYNLGVATIGAGYEERDTIAKGQYIVGVSVPMGATTIGAVYANNLQTDTSAWALGVQYALSKRTNVNFSYSDKSGVGTDATLSAGTGGLSEGSQYQLRLLHSF